MEASKLKTLAQLAVEKQPDPKGNSLRPCFAIALDWLQGRSEELQDAIGSRSEMGYQSYGVYLQPQNGRCATTDILQEALDKMTYLAQEWVEHSQLKSPYCDEILEDFWNEAQHVMRLYRRYQWKNNGGSDPGSETET